jgi:hypothetical protein
MEIGRRYRQVRRIWRENGAQPILDRLRRVLANRLAPPVTPLPVRPSDVLACNPVPRTWLPLRMGRDERLIVNWVTTPPAAIAADYRGKMSQPFASQPIADAAPLPVEPFSNPSRRKGKQPRIVQPHCCWRDSRPTKLLLLERFRKQANTAAVPPNDLHPVARFERKT